MVQGGFWLHKSVNRDLTFEVMRGMLGLASHIGFSDFLNLNKEQDIY